EPFDDVVGILRLGAILKAAPRAIGGSLAAYVEERHDIAIAREVHHRPAAARGLRLGVDAPVAVMEAGAIGRRLEDNGVGRLDRASVDSRAIDRDREPRAVANRHVLSGANPIAVELLAVARIKPRRRNPLGRGGARAADERQCENEEKQCTHGRAPWDKTRAARADKARAAGGRESAVRTPLEALAQGNTHDAACRIRR